MSETKVVIAGSRAIENRKLIFKTLDLMTNNIKVDTILSGVDKGCETIVSEWAEVKDIPVIAYPIKWNDLDVEGADVAINKYEKKYNRNAPKIRNKVMLDNATHLVAIWDGQDIGTKILFEYAKKRKIPVKVFIVDGDNVENHKVDVEPYGDKPNNNTNSNYSAQPSSAPETKPEPSENTTVSNDFDWSDDVL